MWAKKTEGRFILRHPPADTVSDKASAGISREFSALSALHGQAPVARPVAFCSDAGVIGQPFSLTGFVEGVVAVGDEITVRGNRSLDPNEKRLKAVRVIVEGKNYDIYPNRIVTN